MNVGQEESWAAVEAEAEMNYDSRPSLLPDLKKLKAQGESEKKFSELDPNLKKNPRLKELWNRLPDVGPYRIMLTNLPRDMDQESLESELSQHKVTANIEFKPSNRFCYLLFKDKKHCLECAKLYGLRINNCAVQLKITKTEQQAEIRRSNTSRNAARSSNVGTGRFKHLSGRTGHRGETTKHKHPVTGSIRKKRSSNRSNQSSSQSKPTNPWGDSSKSQPKLLSRSNRPPANRSYGDRAVASPAPRRNDDDRGLGRSERSPNFRREERRDFSRRDNDFSHNRRDDDRGFNRRDNDRRGNDRRDNREDRANFRNRGGDNRFGDDDSRSNFRDLNKGRKLRDDDGRADENMNWRNRSQKTVSRKSPPRDILPGRSDKKPADTRSRVSRGDPTRLDMDTRTQNSTQQQRRTNQMKKEQEEKLAAKKKSKNKFAALLEDDED